MQFRGLIYGLVFFVVVTSITKFNYIESPNQEIVLRLTDKQSSNNLSEDSITTLIHHLEAIGVSSISVERTTKHIVRITYHSSDDLTAVKKVIANIEIDNNSNLPTKRNLDFQIFKLQNTTKDQWGFEGVMIVQRPVKSDRLYYPKINYGDYLNSYRLNDWWFFSEATISFSTTLTVKKLNYNVPEVRAGPRDIIMTLS